MTDKLKELQKEKYLDIVFCLWDYGVERANKDFPALSIQQLKTANDYYDSLRCEGCSCGSCVQIYDLADSLSESPASLQPIAQLALKLGEEEYKKLWI